MNLERIFSRAFSQVPTGERLHSIVDAIGILANMLVLIIGREKAAENFYQLADHIATEEKHGTE